MRVQQLTNDQPIRKYDRMRLRVNNEKKTAKLNVLAAWAEKKP